MSTKNQKPTGLFYLVWIFLNATCVVMAWYIAWGIIFLIVNLVGGTIQVGGQSHITEDFLYVYILFPVIGLLTGTSQFMLLRRYLPRMVGWIAVTFLGWLMPFVIGFIFTSLFVPGNSTVWIASGMLVIGMAIAFPQWWILRKRLLHAEWWIPAFGFGWGLVGLLNLVTTDPFPVLLGIAIIPAIATGFACWLLLDWFPDHNFSGLTSI